MVRGSSQHGEMIDGWMDGLLWLVSSRLVSHFSLGAAGLLVPKHVKTGLGTVWRPSFH